jgi:hypothetical protein
MPTPRRWTVAGYRPASRLLRKQWSRCWGVAAGERILAAYPYACMYADYLRGETVAEKNAHLRSMAAKLGRLRA